ncbi:MAG: malonyl-CoA decarboxylase, partial [Polaromonas sp.]|nr:malonyl-CoA decarboxylase [Polaromonas sp.]
MNTSDWLSRSVSRLLPATNPKEKGAAAPVQAAQASAKPGATPPAAAKPAAGSARPTIRSTRERLQATLSEKDEALSPRVLRRTLQELQAIIDPRVSEVEGGRRAMDVANW